MGETHILIVRHPQTEANINGRFVGQGESPFTAVGRAQARRLPARLVRFEPDLVWTSPLERARVVAERTARLAGVPLRIEQRLIELDFGAAHALTWEEIEAAGIPFNYRNEHEPVAPGGESRGDLTRRVGCLLDEVRDLGGRHIFLCHAGVMRAALAHVLDLSGDRLWGFDIRNCQLAHVRYVDGHGMLREFTCG